MPDEDSEGGGSENEREQNSEEGSGGAAAAGAVLGGHAGSMLLKLIVKANRCGGTPPRMQKVLCFNNLGWVGDILSSIIQYSG